MTVKELIDLLQKHRPDAVVVIAFNDDRLYTYVDHVRCVAAGYTNGVEFSRKNGPELCIDDERVVPAVSIFTED